MKRILEINGGNMKSFCREVVSIAENYKPLLRKPNRKINDIIRTYRQLAYTDIMLIIFAVMSYYMLDVPMLSCGLILFFAIISIIASLFAYPRIIKTYKNLLTDNEPTHLLMDEDGIELKKGRFKSYSLEWNQMAFCRAFNNTVSFLGAKSTKLIISVPISYKDEIAKYLRENNISVNCVNM